MSEFNPLPEDSFDKVSGAVSYVAGLYDKYAGELIDLKSYIRSYCDEMDQRPGPRMRRQYDDLEAEILYMLVRETNPQTPVEMSPKDGWSSLWILLALEKNKEERDDVLGGRLYSYDLRDTSSRNLPDRLREQRTMVTGDVSQNVRKLPGEIDLLFVDSAHSAPFARRYFKAIMTRVLNGGMVSIHDVYQPVLRVLPETESRYVRDTLFKDNGINYLSLSSINPFSTLIATALQRDTRLAIEDARALMTRHDVVKARERAMTRVSGVPLDAVGLDLRTQSSLTLLRPNNPSVFFVMDDKVREAASDIADQPDIKPLAGIKSSAWDLIRRSPLFHKG